jgi:chromosome segregation ATPase
MAQKHPKSPQNTQKHPQNTSKITQITKKKKKKKKNTSKSPKNTSKSPKITTKAPKITSKTPKITSKSPKNGSKPLKKQTRLAALDTENTQLRNDLLDSEHRYEFATTARELLKQEVRELENRCVGAKKNWIKNRGGPGASFETKMDDFGGVLREL